MNVQNILSQLIKFRYSELGAPINDNIIEVMVASLNRSNLRKSGKKT